MKSSSSLKGKQSEKQRNGERERERNVAAAALHSESLTAAVDLIESSGTKEGKNRS